MNNNFKLAVNTSIYDGYDLDTIFNSIKNVDLIILNWPIIKDMLVI